MSFKKCNWWGVGGNLNLNKWSRLVCVLLVCLANVKFYSFTWCLCDALQLLPWATQPYNPYQKVWLFGANLCLRGFFIEMQWEVVFLRVLKPHCSCALSAFVACLIKLCVFRNSSVIWPKPWKGFPKFEGLVLLLSLRTSFQPNRVELLWPTA